MTDARRRIARAAAQLLTRGSLADVTVNAVAERSGTPRGSVYHFYPGGRHDILLDAIVLSDVVTTGELRDMSAATALEVARSFVARFRTLLGEDGRGGCPIATLVVDNAPDPLLERGAHAFTSWRDELARQLRLTGVGAADSADVAALLLATCEGAVLLSRADGDVSAFDRATAVLLAEVAALVG